MQGEEEKLSVLSFRSGWWDHGQVTGSTYSEPKWADSEVVSRGHDLARESKAGENPCLWLPASVTGERPTPALLKHNLLLHRVACTRRNPGTVCVSSEDDVVVFHRECLP